MTQNRNTSHLQPNQKYELWSSMLLGIIKTSGCPCPSDTVKSPGFFKPRETHNGRTVTGEKVIGKTVNGKKVIGEKSKWPKRKLIKKKGK